MKDMNHGTEETTIEILYNHYQDENVQDSPEIREQYGKLDCLLQELTLKNNDRIWDVLVRMCDLHEQRGFGAGLRMGVALVRELGDPGQGRDS